MYFCLLLKGKIMWIMCYIINSRHICMSLKCPIVYLRNFKVYLKPVSYDKVIDRLWCSCDQLNGSIL